MTDLFIIVCAVVFFAVLCRKELLRGFRGK